MEYLFIQSILWAKEEGFTRFSVGMAPLSGLAEGPLAPSWSRFGATLFRLGEHFYNFQGLRAYKQKFDPAWEPRYLAGPGGFALPRVLTHVSSLVGGGCGECWHAERRPRRSPRAPGAIRSDERSSRTMQDLFQVEEWAGEGRWSASRRSWWRPGWPTS